MQTDKDQMNAMEKEEGKIVKTSISKKKSTHTTLIAPNGNQYSVLNEELANFKKVFRVNSDWEIL